MKPRVAAFALFVLCGAAVLSWLVATSLRQLDRLQNEYAAFRGQRYNLGVTLRASIRTLNEDLLQFRLTRDPRFRSDFLKEAALLREALRLNRSLPAGLADVETVHKISLSQHLQVLDQVQKEFESYVAETARILDPGNNDAFEECYRLMRAASINFVEQCDELEKAQAGAFRGFLAATDQTLRTQQRLLELSGGLVLVLAIVVAVLVYRGMIAPLRARLSQSQAVIERQERLAALGVLGSGVAHEIRNPLTAIKFRLFSLKKAIPAVAQNEDAIVINSEIDRLERIVKDFLRFARPSDPELAPVPAGALLRDVSGLLSSTLSQAAIRLQLHCEDDLLVRADSQQLKQVLINLVQNGADSIQHGGQITLRARRASAQLPGATGPSVLLSVSDTGKGIPPEIEPRLFDPFFSTKEEGTGLGLATAARIVEKHGGVLRYHTEINRGTTFEILLPEFKNHAGYHPDHRGRPKHSLRAQESA